MKKKMTILLKIKDVERRQRLEAKRHNTWPPNFATITNSPVGCAFSGSEVSNVIRQADKNSSLETF